jgi:hypothetical protein
MWEPKVVGLKGSRWKPEPVLVAPKGPKNAWNTNRNQNHTDSKNNNTQNKQPNQVQGQNGTQSPKASRTPVATPIHRGNGHNPGNLLINIHQVDDFGSKPSSGWYRKSDSMERPPSPGPTIQPSPKSSPPISESRVKLAVTPVPSAVPADSQKEAPPPTNKTEVAIAPKSTTPEAAHSK